MERAQVSIVFAELAGADPGESVSPALPRVLQFLAERDLVASFVVGDELAAAEPFAVTMIDNARHGRLSETPSENARATLQSSPGAWHAAMQRAIGNAVASGEHAVIAFDLAAVERGDGASLLAETLDLIAGLRRAGSLEAVAIEGRS